MEASEFSSPVLLASDSWPCFTLTTLIQMLLSKSNVIVEEGTSGALKQKKAKKKKPNKLKTAFWNDERESRLSALMFAETNGIKSKIKVDSHVKFKYYKY